MHDGKLMTDHQESLFDETDLYPAATTDMVTTLVPSLSWCAGGYGVLAPQFASGNWDKTPTQGLGLPPPGANKV